MGGEIEEDAIEYLITLGDMMAEHGENIQNLVGQHNRGEMELAEILVEANNELQQFDEKLRAVRGSWR